MPDAYDTLPQPSIPPESAWDPLPAAGWDRGAAAHLLRRAGWSAEPESVERAVREGMELTVERLFAAGGAVFPMPGPVADLERDLPDIQRAARQAATPDVRRQIEQEARERSRSALLDMTIRWLEFAAGPEESARAKWVLFLSDVYVVAFEKVPRPFLLYRHFDLIARRGLGPAPELTKAVSRSPAMIHYLDLDQSRREAPNENFARELFELFLLGEGNYTEEDVKQAARAFTGYRADPSGEFRLARAQHDDGVKTVLGTTGRLDGDQVIDVAYGLDAAGSFLPGEWARFYLCDGGIPGPWREALGRRWRAREYDLGWLVRTLFSSRLFYAPEFRGQFIKSPVQFYLGLVQDLGLRVMPVPRLIASPLRRMGQALFDPPNVRGWVGGRQWINSASLQARRALVEMLFSRLNEDALDADERMDLGIARSGGAADFCVPDSLLSPLLGLKPEAAVDRLVRRFLPEDPGPAFREALLAYLAPAPANPAERRRRTKRAAASVIESPHYQLC